MMLQNIFYFLALSAIIAIVVGALTHDSIERQLKHGLIVFSQLVGGIVALTVVVYLLSK